MGAKPFLTDCNTLYPGMRRNALDHLDAAYMNGFSPLQTGCHVIIADGLLGTDFVSVPVNGEYCKQAYIGRAIVDAEAIISLTHFKCHGIPANWGERRLRASCLAKFRPAAVCRSPSTAA